MLSRAPCTTRSKCGGLGVLGVGGEIDGVVTGDAVLGGVDGVGETVVAVVGWG